jgi:hypothetical protein
MAEANPKDAISSASMPQGITSGQKDWQDRAEVDDGMFRNQGSFSPPWKKRSR